MGNSIVFINFITKPSGHNCVLYIYYIVVLGCLHHASVVASARAERDWIEQYVAKGPQKRHGSIRASRHNQRAAIRDYDFVLFGEAPQQFVYISGCFKNHRNFKNICISQLKRYYFNPCERARKIKI